MEPKEHDCNLENFDSSGKENYKFWYFPSIEVVVEMDGYYHIE